MEPIEIKPPIACVYSYCSPPDVRVFPSVGAAEGAVEGVDIEEGDIAYDSEGRLLQFEVTGVRRGRFTVNIGEVELVPAEDTPTHLDEMERYLRADYMRHASKERVYYRHVKLDRAWVNAASLADLLAKGLEFEAENLRSAERMWHGCLLIVGAIMLLFLWLMW